MIILNCVIPVNHTYKKTIKIVWPQLFYQRVQRVKFYRTLKKSVKMSSSKLVFFIVVLFVAVNLTIAQSVSPDCEKFPNKDPKECCTVPNILDKSEFKKCFDEFKVKMEDISVELEPNKGCCISECILNTTGIAINDGTIDKDASKKLLGAKLAGDAEWMPVFEKSFDACMATAIEKKSDFDAAAKVPPKTPGEKMCHPISGFIIGCMHISLFMVSFHSFH